MLTSVAGTWTAKPHVRRRVCRSFRRGFHRGLHRGFQRGFTLLEVMVVLALVGIVTAFAVLSLPGDRLDEQLYREARRLQALLQLNREEAILLGEQRGLLLTPQGYRFQVLGADRQWQALDADPAGARRLPAFVDLDLELEGRRTPLAEDGETPQLVLLASGEASPFRLTLRADGQTGYRLSGALNGELALHSATISE